MGKAEQLQWCNKREGVGAAQGGGDSISGEGGRWSRSSGCSAWNAMIIWRKAIAGVSVLFGRVAPVSGLVLLLQSHRKISRRSYAWPSAVVTGSTITWGE